jgi:hypothetical protein
MMAAIYPALSFQPVCAPGKRKYRESSELLTLFGESWQLSQAQGTLIRRKNRRAARNLNRTVTAPQYRHPLPT